MVIVVPVLVVLVVAVGDGGSRNIVYFVMLYIGAERGRLHWERR